MTAMLARAEGSPSRTMETLPSLKEEINDQAATLMAKALWLSASHFNDLSTSQRRRLIKGMLDDQLGCWLEDSTETLTKLFPLDVLGDLLAALTSSGELNSVSP